MYMRVCVSVCACVTIRLRTAGNDGQRKDSKLGETRLTDRRVGGRQRGGI